jgi:putative phosphoribosyl transferase
MIFSDRTEAGIKLAEMLSTYQGKSVVFALPRGGLPVAAEVAKRLSAPLDLILVRKIGHPGWEEYAIGAVAENAEPVWNITEKNAVRQDWLDEKVKAEQAENKRRRKTYFPKGYSSPSVKGRTAIIVDDGIATGLTMQAAVKSIQAREPDRIVVAVPVAPTDTVAILTTMTDEVLVIDDPNNFSGAVGAHYIHFPQLEDEKVIEILAKASL